MDVGLALRNSSKGQLKYDKYWFDEGRTKEVLDDISKYTTKIAVQISPKLFPIIFNENPCNSEKKDKTEDVPKKSTSFEEKKRKDNIDSTDAYFYELQSEMELPIQGYEEERLKYVQDAFENKKKEFDKYSLEVQEQMKQEYLLAKRKNELDAKRRTGELQKLEQSMIKEAEEMEKLQKEQYQSHVKKLSAKIYEAELRQKQAEEELKKKLQEQEELLCQLKTCLQEANNVVSKSTNKLNSCEYQKYLNVPSSDRQSQMSELLQCISNLISQAKDRELTIDDILNANFQVQKACEIFQEICYDIESAKVKASREQEALANSKFSENVTSRKNSYTDALKSPEKNSKVNANGGPTINASQTVEAIDVSETGAIKEANADAAKIVSHFIAPDAVDYYDKIMSNFKHVDAIVQSLRSDPKNKKIRFELQKAINVPINSLSSNSGTQIKVKINRLLAILTGKAPETSGHDLSKGSVIYNFCANLIAKQFVEQGDTQISSQHSTAFPIAFAALGVWLKQPAVGELLLGHFYEKCPYLVPYYPPQDENQSNEDYFVTLGYKLTEDGSVEPKHKFLNRISGYVRLYAAIIQSPVPPNVNSPHPHGIACGWRWLSRMLNLEPRPDITATVLYDFLDVAGYALQKAYGKQFNKILHILCKGYFKKIKQVTPGGSGGPLERLEIFLQKTAKSGRISPPEGILDANFWIR